MRCAKFLAFAAVAVLSTGCLRASYTINLKPDGSGTIHQTMAMTSVAMQQMAMMGGGESGSVIPDEARLRAAAEGMGQGVRFVGSEPYKEAGFDGVTAIYAFDDVRTLGLSMDKMIAGAIDSPMADQAPTEELKLTFERAADGATLTLFLPELPEPDAAAQDEAAEAADKMPDEMAPQVEAMMKQLLGGLSLEAVLNIEGTLVSTNAPYRDGNRILLMQLDGDELLKGAVDFSQLMNMGSAPGGIEEQLRRIPGLKIVTQPELKITFR